MVYYVRIDASEGIHIDKTSASKGCDICHNWYFLDKGFKFQPYVCNGCHHVLMMSMNLSEIAVLNINGADYGRIITGISKSETINVMQNIDLNIEYRMSNVKSYGGKAADIQDKEMP